MTRKIGCLSRRTFLSAAGGLAAASASRARYARAQARRRLTLVSVRVLQDVTKGPVHDVLTEFRPSNGQVDINWLTFGTPDVQDRVFREAALRNTEVNVGYILPHWLYPEIGERFLALDALDRARPIDRSDMFEGMFAAGRLNNQQLAVPVRGLVHTVHYNKRILAERGVQPPQTIEDFVAAAIQCTYASGAARVYGFAGNTSVQEIYNAFMGFARAFGDADFITPDRRVVVNAEPNLKALELFRELVNARAMPPEWTTYSSTDVIRECRQGRAALTIAPITYYLQFNDSTASREVGNWETAPVPPSRAMRGERQIAYHNVDFWSVVVPKNGPDPELSWDWIRYMTQGDVQTRMAINGNGPVVKSVFRAPEFRARAPFADQALRVLDAARPIWTPFSRISEAIDAFGEEVHACLLGRKQPRDALNDAQRRIERML